MSSTPPTSKKPPNHQNHSTKEILDIPAIVQADFPVVSAVEYLQDLQTVIQSDHSPDMGHQEPQIPNSKSLSIQINDPRCNKEFQVQSEPTNS